MYKQKMYFSIYNKIGKFNYALKPEMFVDCMKML